MGRADRRGRRTSAKASRRDRTWTDPTVGGPRRRHVRLFSGSGWIASGVYLLSLSDQETGDLFPFHAGLAPLVKLAEHPFIGGPNIWIFFADPVYRGDAHKQRVRGIEDDGRRRLERELCWVTRWLQ